MKIDLTQNDDKSVLFKVQDVDGEHQTFCGKTEIQEFIHDLSKFNEHVEEIKNGRKISLQSLHWAQFLSNLQNVLKESDVYEKLNDTSIIPFNFNLKLQRGDLQNIKIEVTKLNCKALFKAAYQRLRRPSLIAIGLAGGLALAGFVAFSLCALPVIASIGSVGFIGVSVMGMVLFVAAAVALFVSARLHDKACPPATDHQQAKSMNALAVAVGETTSTNTDDHVAGQGGD